MYQTNAINFNPTVYFNGSSFFAKDMSNVNLTFATAMTAGDVFGMIKSAAPNSFNNGFPWEYGLYVPGVGGNHYTYGDNNVYDGFGSTQRVAYNPLTYAAHKFAITEWSLYNTYSATNNWGINRNANVILNRTSHFPVISCCTKIGIF